MSTSTTTLLRAMSRQVAAERGEHVRPRPDGVAVRLGRAQQAAWASGQLHRLRLRVPRLDLARFRQALEAVARSYEALQLAVRPDGGRCRLVPAAEQVRRRDTGEPRGDRAPVEYAVRQDGASASVEIEIAVGAHLIDPSGWSPILAALARHYAVPELAARPADPPGLRYGDYCYRAADRHSAPTVRSEQKVAARPNGVEADEPLRRLYAGASLGVVRRSVPPDTELGAVRRAAVEALRQCGWQSRSVVLAEWQGGAGGVLGATARCDVHLVGAGVAGVAGDGPADLELDLVELPVIDFDGQPVDLLPLPRTGSALAVRLLRTPAAAAVVVSGPAGLVEGYAAEVVRRLDGSPSRCPDDRSGTVPAAANQAGPHRPAPGSPAPGIRSITRRLLPSVVEAAVRQRAAELRAAGVGPGVPVLLRLPSGPELVANILAAARCRATLLVIDQGDPEPWRTALADAVAGAVQVDATNRVLRPRTPAAAETPGLLVALSGAPAAPVLATVGWPELDSAAAALARVWRLERGLVPLDVSVAAEDLVVRLLAAASAGLDVAVARDDRELADLLDAAPVAALELTAGRQDRLPLSRLRPRVRSARAPQLSGAEVDVVRWWVAEVPGAGCLVGPHGLTPLADGVRVAAPDGDGVPLGGVGELRLPAAASAGYRRDPRRTADRFRPVRGGGREFCSAALAQRGADAARLIEVDQARTVRHGRTLLLDAWSSVVGTSGVVGVEPPDGTDPERGYVLLAEPPVDGLQLPEPLHSVRVVVDPDATSALSRADARRRVAAACRQEALPPTELPRTATERELAEHVVTPTLGVPVGREQSFFAVGATSLQLVRISLQICERTGVEISLGRLFGDPTIATLAALVDEGRRRTDVPGSDDSETHGLDAALGVIDSFEGAQD